MPDTPHYKQLYQELTESNTYDSAKFTQLYRQVSDAYMKADHLNLDTKVHFWRMITILFREMPQYYDLGMTLIQEDTLHPEYKTRLLNHLATHCGPDNIHLLEIDPADPSTLKAALDKMYNNLLDGHKRYQITHLFGDAADFQVGTSITDPGEGLYYRFAFKQKDGTSRTCDNDRDAEQKLFDAIAAHEQWRPDVVNYLQLINAIHYTMGSESDLRYPGDRLVFEAPITALLKVSAEYIPLLCECYAVFDKWHDVSALEIGVHLVPHLHGDAPEMIYLYAAAYGRALANYELHDTLEDALFDRLTDADYRRQFIPLLAADGVAASIAITYERLHLRGEDLEEELDTREWDEDMKESSLAQYLKSICSAEEYASLTELHDTTIQQCVENPESAPFCILPPDLAELTGIQLNHRGYTRYEPTPVATTIYNTESAAFWQFRDKNYLITADEGWIRLIDMETRQQFTVREVAAPDDRITALLTTQQAHDKSPVHFISNNGYLLQGWHMSQASHRFCIQANTKELFLSPDGSRLVFLTGEKDEENSAPASTKIDIDLLKVPENTVICYDVTSLTELSRWNLPADCDLQVAFTPDCSFVYTNSGKEDKSNQALQWDMMTGNCVNRYKELSDVTLLNMTITPDGRKLIADTSVYQLPEMRYLSSLQTFLFGDSYVSPDTQILAVKGDMADNERMFSMVDLNSGRHLASIHLDEEENLESTAFFSPCNRWFGAIINSYLRVWDLQAILAGTPDEQMESFEIEFPNVSVITMHGAFQVALGATKTNFINEREKLEFQMLSYGEYTATLKSNPEYEGRALQQFNNIEHVQNCQTVVPQVGSTLGALLLPQAKGLQQSFDVKVVLSFPERQHPETGETISHLEWYQEVNHNEALFIGWQITSEAELQPGTWMLEVQKMEESTCLFRRLFTIEKPFKTVDYQLDKLFCGLYADPDVPHTPVSESRIIPGKPGVSFGLQFRFACAGLESPYKIMGEMEHPPLPHPVTSELTTITTRTFKLSDGNSIGFFRRFNNTDEVAFGDWVFRLKDPGLDTVIMEEQLKIVSVDDLDEPAFELIDSGLYTPVTDEDFNLFRNYPKAEQIELSAASDTLPLSENMVFGIKCRYANLVGGKRLVAMVYHPPIKSFFGDDTEEEFSFNLTSDQPVFIGWVMDNPKALLEGEWTIKVWEDEMDEDETPVFEKTFVLTT